MRLIDADELLLAARQEGAYGYVSAKEIADAPTIDAVPVVRCKDCVNFETGDWCVLTGARAREDGYCAWGEREEEP